MNLFFRHIKIQYTPLHKSPTPGPSDRFSKLIPVIHSHLLSLHCQLAHVGRSYPYKEEVSHADTCTAKYSSEF